MTDNLERLKDWIGKTEFMEERASTGRAQGLAALLDKPDTPHEGEPMGLMDHWCFFKPRVRQSDVGLDGHPQARRFHAAGSFAPTDVWRVSHDLS